MIKLFNLPDYTVDTAQFDNLLHGSIVKEFEERFADYVGAKYAVSFNSATSAIFVIARHFFNNQEGRKLTVPSMIPYVVPNAIVTAGCDFDFIDDINWVGSPYKLGEYSFGEIIDSAQHVEKDQYKNQERYSGDMIIYSFYPTKPVGSIGGGMVVTNDESVANALRTYTMNGMTQEKNNWDRRLIRAGYNMYMNSIAAFIGNESLKRLPYKQGRLIDIAKMYNYKLGYSNTSQHLYRIMMMKQGLQRQFIQKAQAAGITCGIHYHAAHLEPVYGKTDNICPQSVAESTITVSIPFHEQLEYKDINQIVDFVKNNDH